MNGRSRIDLRQIAFFKQISPLDPPQCGSGLSANNIAPIIAELQAGGAASLQDIAAVLSVKAGVVPASVRRFDE